MAGSEPLSQRIRRCVASTAARLLFVSNVDFSTQKRSCGQHHANALKTSPIGFRNRQLCLLQPLNPRPIAETGTSWVDVPKFRTAFYKALGLLAP